MTEGEEEEAWEGANQANDLNLEAEHGLFLTHTLVWSQRVKLLRWKEKKMTPKLDRAMN